MLNIKTKGISAESMIKILQYDWPGNIRQLENFIERCVVLSNEREINIDTVDEAITGTPVYAVKDEKNINTVNISSKTSVDNLRLKKVEIETIKKVLAETNGNKKSAAEKLGISVTTLWRRLKKMEE